MKILYVTDLHGHESAYETALERAVRTGVRAIVNGGDMYPLGRDLFPVQQRFIGGYLPGYLERCARAGLGFLCTLGNMDLRGLDSEFMSIMTAAPNAHCLLDEMTLFEGYSFIGSPMSVDGPFALKDRCLRDTDDSADPPEAGWALVSDSAGLHPVDDWPRTCAELPALSCHLASLPLPEDPARAVYVLHQPPFGAGLAMISETVDVGSRAVAQFLAAQGPAQPSRAHPRIPFCRREMALEYRRNNLCPAGTTGGGRLCQCSDRPGKSRDGPQLLKPSPDLHNRKRYVDEPKAMPGMADIRTQHHTCEHAVPVIFGQSVP